jgi:hypothetical protein
MAPDTTTEIPTLRIEFGNEQAPTAEAAIGGCTDVVREGDHLYVLQGRSLRVLSLANPGIPAVVGALDDLGNLRQIAVRDGIAFVTAREDGLFIVDVSDPGSPSLLTRYDTIEFATGIDLRDGFAFIACRWFGVEIVDVRDPANPCHVANVRVGEAQSCEVSDGFLYAGAWEERRVAICDVRNPAAPRHVGTAHLGGRGDGVCVRNGILYAATGHHQRGASLELEDPRYGTGNGMDIFDVSDPANPRHLSRVQFAWRFYYGWPDTWRVKLAYPYAYLCHTYNGVIVLDVSDPCAPREVAQIRIPLPRDDARYRELSIKSPNGKRVPLLPFDPTEKVYSPVCGLVAADGFLYIAALFSGLHILRHATWAKEESSQPTDKARGLSCRGDFHQVEQTSMLHDLAGFAQEIAHWRRRGQVYAAVEEGDLVYAACGSEGIQILDRRLRPLAQHATSGFAMDIQTVGGVLYVAESSGGLARYRMNGARMQLLDRYECKWPVRQVRVTPDGRLAVIQAGGSVYEVLDVSGGAPARLVRTERGWGGLIYYRQLCNGFIDGRYICGTWCAGRTFMLDCGGDEPTPLPDITGVLPDMETGGYCPCGPYALLTREGGYSLLRPGEGGTADNLPVHTLGHGRSFRGKPTCQQGLLVACDRINGVVTLVDVADPRNPKFLGQLTITGNPDCAFIAPDSVLIPAGYQGLFRLQR